MKAQVRAAGAERRMHLATYVTEALVLLGTVLVYKLSVLNLGQEGFEPYVVVRRTISFLQTILLLGLAVAVVRFAAMAVSREKQVGVVQAVAPALGITCLLLLGACAAAPGKVAALIFGDPGHAGLSMPIGLLTVGLLAHSLIYSFWRGTMEMGKANTLQVLNLALVPNAAMWWGRDLVSILWATGLAWTAISLAGLLPVLLSKGGRLPARERSRLFRYGLPRVPGDLVLASLLTLPVYLVNHVEGLSAGAQVAFGLTLVNIAGSVYSPMSLLLLPKVAALLTSRKWEELSHRIKRVALFALLGGIAMVAVFQLVATPLLAWYLGGAGAAMETSCRVAFIGAVFLGVFISLRSVLDAYYLAPRNTFNLLAAFLVFVAGALGYLWAWPHLPAALVGMVLLPLALLAWLTWRGVAWIQRDLARMAPAGEHKVRVLVVIPGGAGPSGMPFAQRQAKAIADMAGFEVRTYFLASRTSLVRLWKSRADLVKMERSFSPDVVHVHYGSVTALFTLLTVRCPLVITYHGSDLNKTPSDGIWRDLAGRLFSQLAAIGASAIICVSPRLRDRLWWRREDAEVIPMGTDITEFRPMERAACRAKLQWPDGPAVLFNAGNPKVKRLDLAEQAMDLVRKNLPAARLVALRGEVGPGEMPLWVNASNLVLLCSDAEGSPTMVKEAMACNVPVVATDVGDVAQRIEGVAPGALVEQDAEAMAQAIRAVLAQDQPSNGREQLVRQGYTSATLDRRVAEVLKNCTWHKEG